MTLGDWRRYMADFVTEVRRAVPEHELTINPVWWRAESSLDDPEVSRAVSAATHFHMERGTEDVFRGQSYDGLLAYADRLHSLGLGVNLDGYLSRSRARAEFELATYYLLSTGSDTVGADYGSCPDARGDSPCEEPFWSGYETKLGAPLAAREPRPDGLLQRRFERGVVLVNPPGSQPRRAEMDGLYTDLEGDLRLSVTLEGGQAVVLRRVL